MGSLRFASLSSGSKANSFFIHYKDTRVLVDCGLSAKEAAKRLHGIGEDADAIDAVIVTHEHSDHIAGVRVFAQRHKTAVYVNPGTFHAAPGTSLAIAEEQLNFFEAGQTFKVGDLMFDPFSVSHDAADPVMFKVSANNRCLVLATDLGYVTPLVRQYVKEAHALVLESNHDPRLLEDAPYPWSVKQRIQGRSGHLSNESAASLVEELAALRLKPEVLLAGHISENSNRPELATDGFEQAWQRGEGGALPVIEAILADKAGSVFSL